MWNSFTLDFIREIRPTLQVFQYTLGLIWYSQIFQQEIYQYQRHAQVNQKNSNVHCLDSSKYNI